MLLSRVDEKSFPKTRKKSPYEPYLVPDVLVYPGRIFLTSLRVIPSFNGPTALRGTRTSRLAAAAVAPRHSAASVAARMIRVLLRIDRQTIRSVHSAAHAMRKGALALLTGSLAAADGRPGATAVAPAMPLVSPRQPKLPRAASTPRRPFVVARQTSRGLLSLRLGSVVKAARKLTLWRRSKTDPLGRAIGRRGVGWRVGAVGEACERRLRASAEVPRVIGQGVWPFHLARLSAARRRGPRPSVEWLDRRRPGRAVAAPGGVGGES